MSILGHLEELRSRVLRCVLALVAGFALAWSFAPRIYGFIVEPAIAQLPPGVKLAYTGVADPFLLYMKVALVGGLFLALPYVLAELWMFVAPGLYRKEKRWVVPFAAGASFFFFLGAAFAYVAIVPFAVRYFISVGQEAGFQPVITVRELLSFELQMILATGGVFEMPVLVFFLTRVGILTPPFMWHYFGHALFVIWLVAAWVTPPDIFSMMLVGLPMTLLYVLSIGVCRLFLPRRAEATAADGSAGA
jgi:sec-independent protein translocase protein TatC